MERILDLEEIENFTEKMYDHFLWDSDDENKVKRELSYTKKI